MSSKPFIIKNKVMETMLPKDSELYDEKQESRIQIVQGINGYLTISMLYEGLKLLWSFWHYRSKCSDLAYLSLGFMVLNVIWGLTSLYGFRSIRKKSSRNITVFWYTLIVNFVLRISMYIVCGVVMKGYVPNYMEIKIQQLNDILCNALYPQILYVISAIFQALICMFTLFLTNSIYHYVLIWERKETDKYREYKFNDL